MCKIKKVAVRIDCIPYIFTIANKRDFENLFFLFKKLFKNYIIKLSKKGGFKSEIMRGG